MDESEACSAGRFRGTYWWIGRGICKGKEDSRVTGRGGGRLLDLAGLCEFLSSLELLCFREMLY